jgi:hypothetical protein
MKVMAEQLIMERLVKGKAPGREFDIEFWQKLGPTRIFEAAWDLVVTAASVRGIRESELRLQRSLRGFNGAGVRYRVVRGYAVMAYTEPRYIEDLGIWIDPSEHNARAVFFCLAAFGAPLKGVQWSDFTQPAVFYQLGVEPVRVAIMTSVADLHFAEAWDRKSVFEFGGEPAHVISLSDLQTAKRAAGRSRDTKDLKLLSRRRP